MPMELTARTAAGRRLVATAERFAEEFAPRAAEHDRDGSYPFESIEALRRAGYFAAPAPRELGGLGVSSLHDVVVASGRLARGDASLAIGVNMHLVVVVNLARRWRMARAAKVARREEAFAASLREIAAGEVVLAAAQSEPGQDLTRPTTEAVRTERGWRIDGHKIFCTMSPAATALLTSVRFLDGDGIERYGYVQIPADAAGVRINDDWDALGMRASGSHSVTFDGVELPEARIPRASQSALKRTPAASAGRCPTSSATSRRGCSTPRRRWASQRRRSRARPARSASARTPGRACSSPSRRSIWRPPA